MTAIGALRWSPFGDLLVKYDEPDSPWFYTTSAKLPKAVFDELVNTWITHNDCVKQLEKESFQAAEQAYKEQGDETDQAYIAGLDRAIKVLREKQ